VSLELDADNVHWPAVARASYRRLDRTEVPPSHPVGLMADWHDAVVGARGCFREQDFSSANLPRIEPWLQILEEGAPGVFRYRFVGGGVDELLEFSDSGQMLGYQVPDHVLERRRKEIADSRRDGKPVFSTSVLPFRGKEFISVIRGIFPCGEENEALVFMPVAPYRL